MKKAIDIDFLNSYQLPGPERWSPVPVLLQGKLTWVLLQEETTQLMLVYLSLKEYGKWGGRI